MAELIIDKTKESELIEAIHELREEVRAMSAIIRGIQKAAAPTEKVAAKPAK